MNDSDILVMRRVKAGISGESSAFSGTKKKKKRRGADNWGLRKHCENCVTVQDSSADNAVWSVALI